MFQKVIFKYIYKVTISAHWLIFFCKLICVYGHNIVSLVHIIKEIVYS